jgi:hypothetical protein
MWETILVQADQRQPLHDPLTYKGNASRRTFWWCCTALGLYLGGACFEFRPEHWQFYHIFRGSDRSLQAHAGIEPRLDQDFQILII